MHWHMHSCITVDAQGFTCSSCGIVWVARIPLSNRAMRDVSKFSTEGLKRMPLTSSLIFVTKSGFPWGLWWAEIGKNRDAFWDNDTQLYCSDADTKMPPGQERKAEERGLSHADKDINHCVLNLPLKTLRTFFYQRWRNHQPRHIRIPKSHNLILRIGAALQKNRRCSSN